MDNKEKTTRPILTLDNSAKQKTHQELKPEIEKLVEDKEIVTPNKSTKAIDESADSQTETTAKTEYDFNAIYHELHAKFPTIINIEKPVLLAIAIRRIMLKEIKDVPNSVLHKWIGWYFRKSNYYALHKVGAMRYNLDGSEAGIVTEKDQAKRDKQLARINNNKT